MAKHQKTCFNRIAVFGDSATQSGRPFAISPLLLSQAFASTSAASADVVHVGKAAHFGALAFACSDEMNKLIVCGNSLMYDVSLAVVVAVPSTASSSRLGASQSSAALLEASNARSSFTPDNVLNNLPDANPLSGQIADLNSLPVAAPHQVYRLQSDGTNSLISMVNSAHKVNCWKESLVCNIPHSSLVQECSVDRNEVRNSSLNVNVGVFSPNMNVVGYSTDQKLQPNSSSSAELVPPDQNVPQKSMKLSTLFSSLPKYAGALVP